MGRELHLKVTVATGDRVTMQSAVPYNAISLLHDPVYGKYKFWRCGMPESNPKLAQQVTEYPLATAICFQQEPTFLDMIQHLRNQHNLRLNPSLDYCGCCGVLFSSSLTAVFHYLRKVINYRHNCLSNETLTISCPTCQHHFDNLELALEHFSKEIQFEDLMTSGGALSSTPLQQQQRPQQSQQQPMEI